MLSVSMAVWADEGSYAISGAGATSCGKYIEGRSFRDRDIDRMFASWIQGFLSGMNTQRLAVTREQMSLLPDAPSILAYVDKFCRETPLADVYQASINLYQDIQTPSPSH
jgi:hypothetical protein